MFLVQVGIPPDGFPELVATTCWYLWWERRKIVHDEPVQLPDQSAFAIGSLAANFTAPSPSKAHLKKQGWTKPPTDWVKLNIDAGFDADSPRATMGAIIRDHHGNFVSATNWKIDFVADVEAAEAHAVRIGLELVALTGCTRVIIESDSSDVVQAITTGSQPMGAAAEIYEDCLSLMEDLSRLEVMHCGRESNSVARTGSAR